MTASRRRILENLRNHGMRLVAEDFEYLFDLEQSGDCFCDVCGQFFALPSDEEGEKKAAWERHKATESHRRGPE